MDGINVRSQAYHGVKWIFVGRIAAKIFSVGTTIILARLLDPNDFGFYSLAFVALNLFDLIKSMGLDAALIQRKDRVIEASYTAFWLLMLSGLFCFGGAYLVAPLAAKLLNSQAVIPLVRTLGVVLIVGVLSSVPGTLMEKELKFKTLSLLDIVSALLSSILAVVLAFLKFDVWSLVYSYVMGRVIRTIGIFIVAGWHPRLFFEKQLAKELWDFGKYKIGQAIFTYLNANLTNAIVGRLMGTRLLGIYSIAFGLSNFLPIFIYFPLDRLMFPLFSRYQEELDKLKVIFFNSLRYFAIPAFCYSGIILVFTPDLIHLVYGQKWMAAVGVVRILAFWSVVNLLLYISSSLFLAIGKPEITLKLAWLRLATMLILLVPGCHYFGLIGAAWGLLFSALPVEIYRIIALSREIQLKFRQILFPLKSNFLALLAMLIFNSLFRFIFAGSLFGAILNPYLTVIGVLGGSGVFFLTIHLNDKDIFPELKNIFAHTILGKDLSPSQFNPFTQAGESPKRS